MDRDRGRDVAVDCRRAAREAVADVEPAHLHDFVVATIDDATMTPGAFAIEAAALAVPGVDCDRIVSTAAAVQLVYEGLSLTRRLAQHPPWEADDERVPAADVRADLEIVAADVMVARGFYLLSDTDAADQAVHTVRAFGRDQTAREQASREDAETTDADDLDANLERDVLELAVVAGASAAGADDHPPELVAAANDLVDAVGTPLPPVSDALRWLDGRIPEHAPGDGASATDRATSATDP